jgi:hypothetical protein
MSEAELGTALASFTGTKNYTRHLGLYLTDGAVFLAEKAKAWWLMDILVSYQPRCRKDPMLREIQFWTLKLKRAPNMKAIVTCERDTGDVAIKQSILFTDFPLDEVKLIVKRGSLDGETVAYVVMLPSER